MYSYSIEKIQKFKKYSALTVGVGASDIATLILVGITAEKRKPTESQLDLKELHFGEDGAYNIYVANSSVEIPEEFKLIYKYKSWLKVYDDNEARLQVYAPYIYIFFNTETDECIIQLCEEEQSLPIRNLFTTEKQNAKQTMVKEARRILFSNKTSYQLSKETGISIALIERYRSGKSQVDNMSLTTFMKLLKSSV